jgi:hypothetical protein
VVWTLSWPYNGGVMPCSKVILAVLFVNIFAAHANIGGVFLNIGRGYSNIGGGYSNIGGGYSNKTSEFKTIFCTNWHAKLKKPPFLVHKNPLFASLALFLLLRSYIPRGREV